MKKIRAYGWASLGGLMVIVAGLLVCVEGRELTGRDAMRPASGAPAMLATRFHLRYRSDNFFSRAGRPSASPAAPARGSRTVSQPVRHAAPSRG